MSDFKLQNYLFTFIETLNGIWLAGLYITITIEKNGLHRHFEVLFTTWLLMVACDVGGGRLH